MPKPDLTQVESELKGKTLLVYWYMLRTPTSDVGVREIQRALRFSSPSIAAHHLEKLMALGLVDKKGTGEYYLTQEIKIGLLKFFTRLGRYMIPRYLFYSVFFSTMLIVYVVLYGRTGSLHNIAALVFGSAATIILWFETIRIWREKPF